MSITRFYPKMTRIPVFSVCILFFFVSVAWAYLLQILPGRAPHLCNFDIKNKNQQQNNIQTQAPKPHGDKTTCALGKFLSGFKHGILSFTFSDNTLGYKSQVAHFEGQMTFGVGWEDPTFLERQVGKAFLSPFW